MAETAVQGLLEFWPCKSVNNPNFWLPIPNFRFRYFLSNSAQLWQLSFGSSDLSTQLRELSFSSSASAAQLGSSVWQLIFYSFVSSTLATQLSISVWKLSLYILDSSACALSLKVFQSC